MIVTTDAYGVLLTDDFGGFYREFSAFSGFKPHDGYDDEDDYGNAFVFPHVSLERYLASCPSAEDYQFVLGFEVTFNKHTDVKAVHEKWLAYLDKLPQEIKDIVENIRKTNPDLLDPDFHSISGHC